MRPSLRDITISDADRAVEALGRRVPDRLRALLEQGGDSFDESLVGLRGIARAVHKRAESLLLGVRDEKERARILELLEMVKGMEGAWECVAETAQRKVFLNIVRAFLSESVEKPKERALQVMTGMSGSGKSTFAAEHQDAHMIVNSDRIHDALNAVFPSLQDDNSVRGSAYWQRQFLAKLVRRESLLHLFAQGTNTVADSVHISALDRKALISAAHRAGYTVELVYVSCSNEELLRRAEERDNVCAARGEPRMWVDLLRAQQHRYQPPKDSEGADTFITIDTSAK